MIVEIMNYKTEKKWSNAYVTDITVGMICATPNIKKARKYDDGDKERLNRILYEHKFDFKMRGDE